MRNQFFNYKTIKTFEDACKEQGIDSACLPNVSMFPIEHRESVLAYCKLIIIYKSINQEWKVDFADGSQKKYWPYFSVEKSSGGRSLRFSASHYIFDFTFTSIGGRLCTNSKEKAEYIGTQFIDLYEDFLLLPDETMLKIDCFLEQIAKPEKLFIEKINDLKKEYSECAKNNDKIRTEEIKNALKQAINNIKEIINI